MRRSLATAILAASLVSIALTTIAVPAVALAGGGCHGGSDAPPPGDEVVSTVKIDGCMFFPTIARVPVGTTVTFLNTGVAPHNVTGVDNRWASAELMPGDRFEHRFAAAGTYPFACTLHPGMNGAVVVGEVGGAAMPAAGTTNDTDPGDTTGAGVAADSTSAAAAAEGTRSPDDALPFGLAALGGLALGVVMGATAALAIARPRSATGRVTSSGSEPAPAD
jgi:plastocyanin